MVSYGTCTWAVWLIDDMFYDEYPLLFLMIFAFFVRFVGGEGGGGLMRMM